jgi:hypothetical protein
LRDRGVPQYIRDGLLARKDKGLEIGSELDLVVDWCDVGGQNNAFGSHGVFLKEGRVVKRGEGVVEVGGMRRGKNESLAF